MRTYNAATVRIAELTGATPVDVTMTEVAAAVAAGRIDSMITSGITGVENKVWGQIRYFYDIRGWAMSAAAAAAALGEMTAHGMKIEPIGFEFRNELRRFGEKFSIEWVRATGQEASAILIPYYTGAAR